MTASTAGDGAAVTVARRLVEAGRSLRWYVRGVTGADAYDRYVDYLHRTHPEAPIPSEGDFWREKYEEMERNPTTRCC